VCDLVDKFNKSQRERLNLAMEDLRQQTAFVGFTIYQIKIIHTPIRKDLKYFFNQSIMKTPWLFRMIVLILA
jgi:hypothetical protein